MANSREVIPPKQYGGGTVMLWDRGHWGPENDPEKGLRQGKLGFTLHGERMKGRWALVRMKPAKGEKREKLADDQHKVRSRRHAATSRASS